MCNDVSGLGMFDSKSEKFVEKCIKVFFIPGLKLARGLGKAVV